MLGTTVTLEQEISYIKNFDVGSSVSGTPSIAFIDSLAGSENMM